MKQSLGLRATLLAYVLPFMIVLLALMVLTSLGMPEVFAGLLSLVMLSVYFVLLHFFKDKLQKTFQFTLNKVN
jgi:positive regulator of sigma E activity